MILPSSLRSLWRPFIGRSSDIFGQRQRQRGSAQQLLLIIRTRVYSQSPIVLHKVQIQIFTIFDCMGKAKDEHFDPSSICCTSPSADTNAFILTQCLKVCPGIVSISSDDDDTFH